MRKPVFFAYTSENKVADKLCRNLVSMNMQKDSKLHFQLKSKPQAIFSECTARFVLYLVGNLEDRFSRDAAYLSHGCLHFFLSELYS